MNQDIQAMQELLEFMRTKNINGELINTTNFTALRNRIDVLTKELETRRGATPNKSEFVQWLDRAHPDTLASITLTFK